MNDYQDVLDEARGWEDLSCYAIRQVLDSDTSAEDREKALDALCGQAWAIGYWARQEQVLEIVGRL